MENFSIVLDYIKNHKKNTLIIALVLIIFLVSCFLIFEINKKPEVKVVEKKIIEKVKIKEKKIIKVDIKGEVVKPGVYEVEKGTRINDVIKLAGGLTYRANTKYINLSKKVKDEMVIFIYSDYEISKFKEKEKIKEELPIIKDENLITSNVTEDEDNDTDGKTNGKININTATEAELMTLTGIGESKAKAIIEYRKKNKFKTIEDIKEVSGIGDSVFDKIKENITV